MARQSGFTHTPPSDEILEKERRALELRRAGAAFDVIAQQVGYADKAGAHKAYKRALARTLQPAADELRQTEADRLDKLQMAVWSSALRGNLGAVDRNVRIMERRARLLGLDHADGLAERQVRLAEEQGRLVAGAVERITEALLAAVLGRMSETAGERLRAEWPALVATVVPQELRAIEATQEEG